MNTNDAIKNRVIQLRIEERLSLADISSQTGVSKSSCARILKEYPLTDDERKVIWSSKIKGKKRKADGRLDSGPDLTGKTFGRLTVLHRVFSQCNSPKWKCICECGKIKDIRSDCLINQVTLSCGCLNRDLTKARQYKDPIAVNLRSLYLSYKASAFSRNLVFELSEELCDSIFKQNCFYCGIEPRQERKVHRYEEGSERDVSYLYNGIDRVDNNKGYIIENCVACCKICNYAKKSMGYTTFLEWIKRIALHQSA